MLQIATCPKAIRLRPVRAAGRSAFAKATAGPDEAVSDFPGGGGEELSQVEH